MGVGRDTALHWRRKCPHLEEEIAVIREVGRQNRYEEVREAQRKHLTLAERLRDDLAADPNMAESAAKVRLFDAVTRALDVERKAAEPRRTDSPSVLIQNNQTAGGDDAGVASVYTDAERSEIADILEAANGAPAVVEGEIVEDGS